MNASVSALFPLGRIVATPAALELLRADGQSPLVFLRRHVAGDWGDVPEDDKLLNDRAVAEGERILSAYRTSDGQRLWIITERDRSVTTILRPEEY